MTNGIQVLNESGYTQIDSSYSNLQVLLSGTTSNFPQAATLVTNLPSNLGTDFVIFIKPSATSGVGQGNTVTFWGYIDYSANTFVIGRTLSFSFYQGSFDYVICTEALTAPSTGYGLNTYNSDGSLAFSSEYKDMECVEAHTYTLSYPPSVNFNFNENNPGWKTGTDVYDYYVCLNAMGKVARTSSGGSTYYRASFAHYQYEGGISGNPQYISIGANWGLTAPVVSGTTTTVESQDTRTQVIARYNG
tara:strand:+ start:476 stop:1216 length:741 start_codon:yes stop_codon:yes gene_type:complete